MTTCQVVEWSPKETNMGFCGRQLVDGACPTHGPAITAPVSAMVFPKPKSEILASMIRRYEPKPNPSWRKRLVLSIGKWLMVWGLLLMPLVFLKLFIVGLVMFLAGFQIWITAKCWMR